MKKTVIMFLIDGSNFSNPPLFYHKHSQQYHLPLKMKLLFYRYKLFGVQRFRYFEALNFVLCHRHKSMIRSGTRNFETFYESNLKFCFILSYFLTVNIKLHNPFQVFRAKTKHILSH